jgi:hypothetical protein
MSLTFPKSLLQTLQTAFEAEGKRIAKDVSKVLNVEEKELLQILKKIPKVQINSLDDSDCSTSCPVLFRNGSLAYRCKKPCILGTSRCIHHQTTDPIASIPEHIVNVTKICHSGLQDSYLCDEETKNVYDSFGKQVGELTEENTLCIYTFDE